MAAAKTPRGRTLRWHTRHRGITEDPPDSNTDHRKDGIRAAQLRAATWLVGKAWCGVWALSGALAGGVRPTKPWRWASVALIEDDAKQGRNGFRGWTTDPSKVMRGDLGVLERRGYHVFTVRRIFRRLGLVLTSEGNTSRGRKGSQDNGGVACTRWRLLSQVHGYALVSYPDH